MIYVWLKNIKRMHKYNSLEEFSESLDYYYLTSGLCNAFEAFREYGTPLWRENE